MRPSVALDMKCCARSSEPLSHDSDLDLLADARPGATFLDFGDLQDKLQSLPGVHVDLLTPGVLPPKFRARVLAEAQSI